MDRRPPPIRVYRTRDPEHPRPSARWSWACRPCIAIDCAPTQPAALTAGLAHLATHASEPQR
ncbi:hypothetical protein ACFRCG_39750 [Embleya sp. NPDC056575]|uniref:hypothetical protein n=1 Tax=Embleya sp. NPDC056575 TaxID=3345869 RepID=UPI00368FAAB6